MTDFESVNTVVDVYPGKTMLKKWNADLRGLKIIV